MRIASSHIALVALAVLSTGCESEQAEQPDQGESPYGPPADLRVVPLTPRLAPADPLLEAALTEPSLRGIPDLEFDSEQGIVVGSVTLPGPEILAAPGGFGVPAMPDSCSPQYLLDTTGPTPVDNRLAWWNATVPSTGPITQPFVCEFSVALTTVVGAPQVGDTVEQLPAGGLYQRVDWPAAGQSPNPPPRPVDERGIPIPVPSDERVDFVFRNIRPDSQPVVRSLVNNANGTNLAVVNESESGTLPDLGDSDEFEFRPSIWIDFAIPQRAVGIEYGVAGHGGFDASGVRLIAYDVNGNEIGATFEALGAGSDGKARPAGGDSSASPVGANVGIGVNNLTGNRYTHPIGVRDRLGRIATVELRFDWYQADQVRIGSMDPQKVIEPQAITRVWYEPLPPVAVRQGVAGVEMPPHSGPAEGQFGHPEFQETYGVAAGPVQEALPFQFDRALVFMRGARFMFMDFDPREIRRMQAGLSQDAAEFPRFGDRSVTITPSGQLSASPAGPFRVVSYYTVLAWDSRQVSLYSEAGSTGLLTIPQRAQQVLLNNMQRMQVNSMVVPSPCRGQPCDTFFGGLTGIEFLFENTSEIDELFLLSGAQRFLAGASESPMLRRQRDGTVQWSFNSDFDGDGLHSFGANGRVIAGPSLILGPADASDLNSEEQAATVNARTADGIIVCTSGSCPDGSDPSESGPRHPVNELGLFPSAGWDWPVLADAAFLGFSLGQVEPDGPIEQLDWEFGVTGFDGHVVDWKMGFGINTLPPIGNRSRERGMFGTPAFGGVVRHDLAQQTLAGTDLIDVQNGIVGLSAYGETPGAIHNEGSVGPLVITGIERPSDADNDLFEFVFLVPRHPADGQTPLSWIRLGEDQFRARLPYTLRPGKSIIVNTRYTPDEEAFYGDPPTTGRHTGLARIKTASLRYPSLTIFVTGSARPADPGGEWRPDSLAFIDGTTAQEKFAMLLATGSTPLIINQVSLIGPGTGYSFEQVRSIEPDVAVFRVNCGGGIDPCSGTAQLDADTNAGLISLSLEALSP